MTPDLLSRLITDLRALVAAMQPVITLAQQFAGAASHGTQRLHRAGVAPARQAGNEGPDVLARGAAPAA